MLQSYVYCLRSFAPGLLLHTGLRFRGFGSAMESPFTKEQNGHANSGVGGAMDAGSRIAAKKWEPWAEALWNMAMHPEKHGDTILQVTTEAIVLPDKFPKARKHLLVVSRQDGLDSLADLRSSHLLLLRDMEALGRTWVQTLLQQDQSLVFRLGYHSEPSMRQLHMHVISQDFDSPSLKNKKHWNSFTTSFFRDSKSVIEELENTGMVKPCGDESSLMKMDLRCHRCRGIQANIPRLKQHIQWCQAPFPSELAQKGILLVA